MAACIRNARYTLAPRTRLLRFMTMNSSHQHKNDIVEHKHSKLFEDGKKLNALVNRDKFKHVMMEFKKADKYRRGHMSFVRIALARLDDFNLTTDLVTYNRLLDLFPKGKYNNKTLLDAVWPKPHPQIDLALRVLQSMEEYGVRPDDVTYSVLVDVFGRDSFPVDKCKRIAIWFDRYENSDPYKVRGDLPHAPEDLGSLIISRMTSNKADINVYKDITEDSCIVSGVVPYMKHWGSASQPDGQLLHITGPHRIWVKKTLFNYFVLEHQTDPAAGDSLNAGVLAVAYSAIESVEQLQQWLQHLQATHTALREASVVFDIHNSNSVEVVDS